MEPCLLELINGAKRIENVNYASNNNSNNNNDDDDNIVNKFLLVVR